METRNGSGLQERAASCSKAPKIAASRAGGIWAWRISCLDFIADLFIGLRFLRVQLHLALIDFRRQVVMGQESLIGPGGDGKALRDGEVYPVQHFS